MKIPDKDKIRIARGTRSLKQIADASGGAFTKAVLSNWERGENAPPPKQWPALIAALGVTFDDIAIELPEYEAAA